MSASKKQFLKIYAIIHDGNVFIGKTQGQIDAVFYQHRRAQNSFTSEYFYPKNSKNPSIHILEDILCSHSDGYRHIVAWVRIFQDAGYQIINPPGTVEDANDLHPKTTALVKRLRPISLDNRLSITQYSKKQKCILSSTSTSAKASQPKKEKICEKITLRTAPEEKEFFVTYAKSLGLTQSQTLQYLIRKVHLEEADPLFPAWDNDTFIHLLQESHTQEIDDKNKEIYKLKRALRVHAEENAQQSKKLNQCCAIARKALFTFFDFFDSTAAIPLDIERGRYENYITSLPDEMVYTYPVHSGATLLRLQAVLIGDGTAPARFILGVDQSGQLIRLRYYPSVYFFGIFPGNEQFSQRNSVWYMAWRMSKDVAELIVAYPLQIRTKYQNPMDINEVFDKWLDKLAD